MADHADETTEVRTSNSKQQALEEAQACLGSMKKDARQFQLEGFNLLGVVANPRSGGPTHRSTTHTPSSSVHPPVGEGGTEGGEQQSSSSDYFFFNEAAQSLGSTFQQVTDNIETLNVFLEELSREYLGDDGGEARFLEYYYQQEATEEEQEVPTPPPLLANLQLTELQTYLEACGDLAQSFTTHASETNRKEQALASITQPDRSGSSSSGDLSYYDPAGSDIEHWPDLPSVFNDKDFDLTNPSTFESLLLMAPAALEQQERSDDGETTIEDTTDKSQKHNSLHQTTSELVSLAHPEAFSAQLDKVELALQEQVRQKSGAFFQETTRFRELSTGIMELLGLVQGLRTKVQLMSRNLQHVADIDQLDEQRRQLSKLSNILDAAVDLVDCKTSIGGLVVSANDPLSAAEQIQYGKRLYRGALPTSSHQDGDEDDQQDHQVVDLQVLTALSGCGAQFDKYQDLVVQNLSEELVELLLHSSANFGVLEERVGPLVQALNVCEALDKTGELYIRRLQQLVRMTVRTTISEFVEQATGGVTGMSQDAFGGCLDMLLEELLTLLKTAETVDAFCEKKGILSETAINGKIPSENGASDEKNGSTRWTKRAVASGAELASKSVAELLRLRKEAHALLKLDEMKALWDSCLKFITQIEGYSGAKAVSLRSTMVGQAKAFLDHTHTSNMSALVAALDSERWTQCEVSSERQASLTRLCTGRAIVASKALGSPADLGGQSSSEKKPTADVEGVSYKVVWSCLLLNEMIMTNLSAAALFHSLAANVVAKISELLRLFNTRSTQLILGAGAIHSAARLKSINAKHLSLVTQCLGMMLALLPHIRAALMAQLPPKQHALLSDLDTIKKDYVNHNEKVLHKFVSIIGGIVEHGLAPKIANTDFDARARILSNETGDSVECCVFLEGISTNTRKMHQVLNAMLPPVHLQDVFSRIFAYVDQKVPALLIEAANANPNGAGPSTFRFPETDDGKRRLLKEVGAMTKKLNGLEGVHPWDFTAMDVMQRKLDLKFADNSSSHDEISAEVTAKNIDADATPAASAKVSGDETAEKDREEVEDQPTTHSDIVNSDVNGSKTPDQTPANGDAISDAPGSDNVEQEEADTTGLKVNG